MSSFPIRIAAIAAVVTASSIASAQTWTGNASSIWTDLNNWDTLSVPVSGNTATFNGAGNANTSISLGAATQPIGSILFDTASAAAYSLGLPATTDQFNIDSGGAITVNSTVTNLETINAAIQTSGALTTTVSNSAAGTAGLVLNGVISGPGPLSYAGAGAVYLNGQNTYSGGTSLIGPAENIRLGADSVGAPGSVTAGPFGTGTVNMNNGTPAILQPIGADRTIGNAFTYTSGLFASTASATVDPTGPHSLTLSGPITTGGTATRLITSNLASGATLNVGAAGSPSTISLVSALGFQTQASATGGGKIIVNDVISGDASVDVQNGAFVTFTNANTYTGVASPGRTTLLGTNVQGTPATSTLMVKNTTGSATGTGPVNVRTGTLSGNGTIGGQVVMLTSSNGPSYLAPGISGAGNANGPGKLNVGSLTFNTGSTNCSGCNFNVEIGGTTAGTQYDQVVSTGTATISSTATPKGTLNVSLINGFATPSASTDFTILTASSVAGVFANVNLPDANWSIVYNPTSIVLHVAGVAGLPGDFNSDGKVDAGDYVVWRKYEGTNHALPNDGGFGTPVSLNQYTLWRTNFGNPPGAGSGGGLGATAVPEPGTMALVIFAIMGIGCLRRDLYSRNG